MQSFLNRMGEKIKGAWTHVIKIKGVHHLKEVSYNIMSDRIEAGTFLCAAVITGGIIALGKANSKNIKPVLDKL